MGLITSRTLVRALSVFHIVLSYYLLTSPIKLINHNLVVVLGSAMELPPADPSIFSAISATSPTSAQSLSAPNPAAALAALFLAFFALSDLTAAALPEEIYSPVFSAQTLVRLFFLFFLTAWVWLFRPTQAAAGVLQAAVRSKSWGEELKNGFVFTWGLFEIVVMFWIYNALRDERRQSVITAAEKRRSQEERL